MTLNNDIRALIENNIDLIDNKKFDDLFLINKPLNTDLIQILDEAQIDWIRYATCIPTYAYSDRDITNIVIPDNITAIKDYAFYNCNKLTNIVMGDNITSIGYKAFYKCSSLKNITIPDGVIIIDDGAFSGCSNLENITIPKSVTSIGYEAFFRCHSLTSITIPDSVTRIGSSAFSYCNNVETATIPALAILYIPKTNLKTVVITSGESIGKRAFYDCISLTSVTIPDSVTSIGDSAFEDCSSLTDVTIGNGVTSIGIDAFRGCHDLVVNYMSTKNNFENIVKYNKCFEKSTKIHCIDGVIYY